MGGTLLALGKHMFLVRKRVLAGLEFDTQRRALQLEGIAKGLLQISDYSCPVLCPARCRG